MYGCKYGRFSRNVRLQNGCAYGRWYGRRTSTFLRHIPYVCTCTCYTYVCSVTVQTQVWVDNSFTIDSASCSFSTYICTYIRLVHVMYISSLLTHFLYSTIFSMCWHTACGTSSSSSSGLFGVLCQCSLHSRPSGCSPKLPSCQLPHNQQECELKSFSCGIKIRFAVM